jgi:hypothetical protein
MHTTRPDLPRLPMHDAETFRSPALAAFLGMVIVMATLAPAMVG